MKKKKKQIKALEKLASAIYELDGENYQHKLVMDPLCTSLNRALTLTKGNHDDVLYPIILAVTAETKRHNESTRRFYDAVVDCLEYLKAAIEKKPKD